MKVNKKADVSASLREKIVSGKIGEYIPEKQSYKTYRELVVEYQDKLFKFIQDNEPLPLKWNETWFEQNGYLVKPDSPRGSLEELDLFRVSSQTKRKFEGYRQTPDFEPIEGWGSNSKLKSPFNLEKLEAHHVRGLMQESTFLQGLSEKEAVELVNRMWKSGRTKFGNTKLNRIDLQDKQHLNAYSAEELAALREADPDAVGIVFNKETGKWEKQGWIKKNNKWSNPLYKGTGAHNLLAEYGISDITGAPMFSPETMKGMEGKDLDQRFKAWSGWYDYTDRTIEQVLVEAKTNPRNFRGKIFPQGHSFQELVQRQPAEKVMAIVDEAFPDLSPEARFLVENDVFGPKSTTQAKVQELLAKPTPTLELSRIQQQDVNDALREALFNKESKRTKATPGTARVREAADKIGGVNLGQKETILQPNPLARALSGRGLGFAPNPDGTVSYNAGLGYQEVDALTKGIWEMGEEGRRLNLEAIDNLKAPMALSEGATVAGKLARKAGALVPFAGAAFDTIDANEKVRRAFQDPTFLNNLQATMAVGTVGTSFWNEPTNFVLGIGNLGIDVARGAHSLITDEEERERAYNTFRALGQGSLKALGLLKY